MDKYSRSYQLLIDSTDIPLEHFQGEALISSILSNVTSSAKVTIAPPFTLEFDVSRNILASANTGLFKIYNLGSENRKSIYKDPYTIATYKGIELNAGYQDSNATIFKGNVKQASSAREGVNFITTVEAFDAGFAFVNSNDAEKFSFKKGTPYNDILTTLIKSMPAVTVGKVGDFPGVLPRGNSYAANSAELAKELSGGAFFVDLERGYCLGDNECIKGSLATIDSSFGLLNTPRREGTVITIDILFEPRILIGQLIELKSVTEKGFNDTYKVISVHHKGTISGAICGEAVTTVGLWIGTQKLKVVT